MTLKIGYEPIKGDPEDDSCDHSDNDDTQDEEEFSNPEVYTEEEMEAVEGHIEQYFGKVENVFHELVSPDIHVDICIVPPTEERDYYTLVTMGMGAHRMNVPEELAEYKLERAELAIALPRNWKLKHEDLKNERWYWPIRLLKTLARRGAPTTLVAADATHVLAGRAALDLFLRNGGELRVRRELTIAAVGANPWSAYGWHFEPDKFVRALREVIDLPVVNVKED